MYLQASPWWLGSAPRGIAVAIAVCAIALLVRQLAGPWPTGPSFITFLLGALLAAAMTGWRVAAASILVTGTAAVAMPDVLVPDPTDGPSVTLLVAFTLVAGIIVALVTRQRAAHAAGAAERARIVGLLAQHRILFREVQARSASAFATQAGMLAAMAARDPDAASAVTLGRIADRLRAIGAVQRHLDHPPPDAPGLTTVLTGLGRDLVAGLGRADIEVAVTVTAAPTDPDSPTLLDAVDTATLGMIVAEAVVNSVRHGLRDGRAGRITIVLAEAAANQRVLTVHDDGAGLAMPVDPAGPTLGMKILHGLAFELGGMLELGPAPGGGVLLRVLFDARTPTPGWGG